MHSRTTHPSSFFCRRLCVRLPRLLPTTAVGRLYGSISERSSRIPRCSSLVVSSGSIFGFFHQRIGVWRRSARGQISRLLSPVCCLFGSQLPQNTVPQRFGELVALLCRQAKPDQSFNII